MQSRRIGNVTVSAIGLGGMPLSIDGRDYAVSVSMGVSVYPRDGSAAPELLLDVTVQPVIFVLLFVYIFGGAISTPGTSSASRQP